MTARRQARTMMEAFPADHWQGVITRYRRPLAERIADVLMAAVIGIAAAVLLVHHMSK